MKYELYLASASPRRRELLDMLGFSYTLLLPSVDESSEEKDPAMLVRELSARKACAAFMMLPEEKRKNALVLGSDTVVYAGGEILGKPKDAADAARMLSALEGTTHEVLSGISFVTLEGVFSDNDRTVVHFGEMSPEEIDAYVATAEPMDKAGAYAVQGICSLWIDGIEGCHFNVIGLPIRKMYTLLRKMGIEPIKLMESAGSV